MSELALDEIAERLRKPPQTAAGLERCLTLDEVADSLGLTPKALRNVIYDRQVPVLWFSRRTIRFDRKALDALREALRPADEPPELEEIEAPPIARGRDGWVYFIQAGDHGAIKIGTAINVRQRLKTLQVGHHQPLRLVGYMLGGRSLEQQLLAEYSEHRVSGEWHEPVDHLIQFIRVCGRA